MAMIEFHRGAAGVICFTVGDITVHLGVRRQDRVWGRDEWYYDGPLYSFGLGPLLLICW